jgi:hypothetical protein
VASRTRTRNDAYASFHAESRSFGKTKTKTETKDAAPTLPDCGPEPQEPKDCTEQASTAYAECMKVVGEVYYCKTQQRAVYELCNSTWTQQMANYKQALSEYMRCMSGGRR